MTPQSISPQPPTANAQLRDRLYTIAEGLTHPDARKIAAILGRMKDENQAEFERLKTNGRQLVSLIKHRREELLVAFHALEDATQRTREAYRVRMEQITKASNDYRKQTRMVRALSPLSLRKDFSDSRNGPLAIRYSKNEQPRTINLKEFEKKIIEQVGGNAANLLKQHVETYHSALKSTFGSLDVGSISLPPHLVKTSILLTNDYWQNNIEPLALQAQHNEGLFQLCRSVMIGAVTGGWTGQHLLLSIPLISEVAAWAGSLIGAYMGYQIYCKEVEEAARRYIRETVAEVVHRITTHTTYLLVQHSNCWDTYLQELETGLKQRAITDLNQSLQANESKQASVKKEMKQLEQAARELNHLGRLVASPTNIRPLHPKVTPSLAVGRVPTQTSTS